ncbi:MAG: Sua5/YciO/YrdC/YwlC family protein, partial [Cyclobacteriaceae bacterium]
MIDLIVEELGKGQIIALKGIGGFLLLCDARSTEAIATLRASKQRPSKPFAVLYPDFTSIASGYVVSSSERASLLSPAAPIVLLEATSRVDLPLASIAPGLDRLGVMVPYAPLLELIATQFASPLIATSANVSGSPILHDEDESQLFQLADFVLSN